MTFGMFDVLDAVKGSQQKFAERQLARTQWLTPQIVALDHQQIECTSDGKVIGSAAMQGVEIWNACVVKTDHLGIHHRAAFDARGCFHNAGVAVRPVGPVYGVKPHPAIPDMYLQPIAIVLQLVRPARSRWGLFSDDWLTRMNESGGRI